MLRRCASAVTALLLFGCAARTLPFEQPGQSRVLKTGSSSMIYIARTSAGIVVIDLGWITASSRLREELRKLDADSSDVAAVFLTHAHRDHIAAWPLVARAPFYLGDPEHEFLFGRFHYRAPIPGIADELQPPHLPREDEIEVRPFSSDTIIVIGADTARAFPVPGHTPGSSAYLFRGVLFAGDALSHTPWGRYGSALYVYSEDPARARRSLARLFERVAGLDVRYVCTAHAKCARFTPEFVRDALAPGLGR